MDLMALVLAFVSGALVALAAMGLRVVWQEHVYQRRWDAIVDDWQDDHVIGEDGWCSCGDFSVMTTDPRDPVALERRLDGDIRGWIGEPKNAIAEVMDDLMERYGDDDALVYPPLYVDGLSGLPRAATPVATVEPSLKAMDALNDRLDAVEMRCNGFDFDIDSLDRRLDWLSEDVMGEPFMQQIEELYESVDALDTRLDNLIAAEMDAAFERDLDVALDRNGYTAGNGYAPVAATPTQSVDYSELRGICGDYDCE